MVCVLVATLIRNAAEYPSRLTALRRLVTPAPVVSAQKKSSQVAVSQDARFDANVTGDTSIVVVGA